jgi:mycothiol synthase
LLALRHHGLTTGIILAADEDGFAYLHGLSGAGRPELDLVVAPEARGQGVGAALASAVLDLADGIPVTAWSHGNHPAARALAGRLGFTSVRELWLMRRLSSAPLPDAATPAGVTIRPFRPGTSDEQQFLAVNAAAFASHPEQGSLDHTGLAERMEEDWFDPSGFLVAERDSQLVGFHWTKVHPASSDSPAYGEVYVIGVDPHAQAGGLGRALLVAGLRHLVAGLRHLHEGRLNLERGAAQPRTEGGSTSNEGRLDEVVLYVEGENAGAIRMYESFGFTHAARDTDVLYARS